MYIYINHIHVASILLLNLSPFEGRYFFSSFSVLAVIPPLSKSVSYLFLSFSFIQPLFVYHSRHFS